VLNCDKWGETSMGPTLMLTGDIDGLHHQSLVFEIKMFLYVS
jgi:hypothetical protein